MVDFNPALGAQPHERLYANQLSEGLRKNKYTLVDRFHHQPALLNYGTQTAPSSLPTLPGAADAADTLTSIYLASGVGGKYVEMYQTTAHALKPLIHADKGLEIGLDKVDNESVEYVPGGNRASNPLGYKAGTDPGVFIRATFEFADTSGSDQFIVGYRKQENYVVPVSFLSAGDALYTDFAGIGFSGTAASNLVKSTTDLNNIGSTVVTSSAFAWADGKVHQLEVRVRGRVVSYFINGVRTGDKVTKDALGDAITAQATVALPAFTFDSGDFLIPFIFHRFDLTAPGAVHLRRLEVGQLLEVGLQPDGRGPQ